ncbi:unnamed protein product [Gordionus sp. m RMFG-2023]
MIKLFLFCVSLPIKYVRLTEDACPKRPIFNEKLTQATPSNIPFTLVSISLADVVGAKTPVEVKYDSYRYPDSNIERYIKHGYYVANIKGHVRSFAFGRLDFTNRATFFDGIIYENGKLHFVEQIQEWQSFSAKLAGKSSLSDKWGMRKWAEERKYLYYTEDDIEPLSHINDSIEVPFAPGKSLVEQWRQKVNARAVMANQLENTYGGYFAAIKKVCSVNVLLDSYFMENVVKYNIKQAIHEAIILYGSLDFLYRILDFAGVSQPNHFGFQIAKITIIMRSTDYAPVQSMYPLAHKYIDLISSTRIGENRCLGVSFTYQNLEGVVGQAFQGTELGGIFMDYKDVGRFKGNRNVAYVNFMINASSQFKARGSILSTLAHEVGHAFGAIHEEDTRCTRSNRKLMAAYLKEIEGFQHFKFSQCNINLMKHHIARRKDKFLKCPNELRVYDDLGYQGQIDY